MGQSAANQRDIIAETDFHRIINLKRGGRYCIDQVNLPVGTVVKAGPVFTREGD